ncbi:MAG: endolytic transglycosylase MltG, partial [Vallitaleaceae bacterium]|nr:endolytic transglycosylase MltG [Vallitaleaceae bacterium]
MIKSVVLSIVNLIGKVAILVIAVYVLIYGGRLAFSTGYELMVKSPTQADSIVDVTITIPEGSSTAEIADVLFENNLIGSTFYFRILAKLSGSDSAFQYGDYTFNTSMSEEDIMTIMKTEGFRRETIKFTIPEGYTVDQIARLMESEGICTSSEFLAAVYDSSYGYDFIDQIPERNLELQGYLFPDTYEIYADATPEQIVSTMLSQFDTVFKDEYYARAAELGYTIDEIITIASVIEREVRVPSEQVRVSGVIYNRLNIDMKLEMCSTVMYVLDKPQDRLLYSDLKIDSPYNTYIYSGLPVGPIANPGENAIIAALYPETNTYLFFVLK